MASRARLVLLALVSFSPAVAGGQQPAATSTDTMPASVVQRFVDAANARDVKAMAALVAPGAVFARFPDGRVILQGRDSIEAHYSRSLTSAPAAFRITVAPRIVEGRIIIDQEHFTGLPSGRSQATWMYEVYGGLIHRAWVVEGR